MKRKDGDFYRGILAMLDAKQDSNLSAHLYSAFLIKRDRPLDRTRRVLASRVPHKFWTAWPTENVIPPAILDDSVPDDTPQEVSIGEIHALQEPYVEKDPKKVLLAACEAYLQRLVYDRIHAEVPKRQARLDHEPSASDISLPEILAILDKYVHTPLARKRKSRPAYTNFKDLNIEGPAKKRIRSLFGDGITDNVTVLEPLEGPASKRPKTEQPRTDEPNPGGGPAVKLERGASESVTEQ